MTDSSHSLWQRLLLAVRRPLPWWPPVRQPLDPAGVDDRWRKEVTDFQLGLLQTAFGDDGVGGVPFVDKTHGQAYLAHPGRVLCLIGDVPRIEGFFSDRQDTYVGTGSPQELFGELVRHDLPRRVDGQPVEAADVLDDLEEVLGTDVARPDHVIYVTPGGGSLLCPYGEPELPPSKTPVPARTTNSDAGAGVRVSIVDTGWVEEARTNVDTPWLNTPGVSIEGDPEYVDQGDIGSYVGHGTFVAGIIRCLAPATALEIEGLMRTAGAVYESDMATELDEAMTDGDLPDLVSISAGCYTRHDNGLLAFEELARRQGYDTGRGPLVVAAAGNDHQKRPFYPAAYEWVVGVGAVDAQLAVPKFSNYGGWVDVWAQGTKLVNAFPAGTYVVKEPGPTKGEVRTFTGLAQWSGTSFSTPIVTGLIAAHMSQHKVSAREAFAALKKQGKVFSDPKVSKGIALGPPFS